MQARQMYLEAQTVEFVDMLTEYIYQSIEYFFLSSIDICILYFNVI